jgi:hypothetical protein
VDCGDFCVKLHLCSKKDGFEWVFIPVYGAAQDSLKYLFLSEQVRMCESEPLSMLLGGDFNMSVDFLPRRIDATPLIAVRCT